MDFNRCLSVLVNVLIRHYFQDVHCFFAITEGQSFDYFSNISIPHVNMKITDSTHDYTLLFNNFACQGFVIDTTDLPITLTQLEYHIRRQNERFNRRRYLLISTNDIIRNKERLFSLFELKFIADLLLVEADAQETQFVGNMSQDSCKGSVFSLWTHKYVGVSGHKDKVLLNKWFSDNGSFLHGNNLYPDKISHQLARELKMATFTYEPYSVVESGPKTVGSEMNLMVLYSKMHDMTPVVVTDKHEWGESYSNWTGNGILGNLVEDKADVGFGALYTWEYYYSYLDISKPLVRTGISLLVPAPRLLSNWSTPTRTYSPSLWLAFLMTYIAIVVTLWIILRFYPFSKYTKYWRSPTLHLSERCMMMVGKIMLGQSLTQGDQRHAEVANMLLVIIHLTCLTITSTYSSGLASTLTIPRYEASINTVEDFAARDFRWGATSNAWVTSIEDSTEPSYVNIVNRFLIAKKDVLQNFSRTDDFAFSIERLPYDNFAVGSYIQRAVIGNYHLMEEDLYWEYCVIMTRKHSVLLDSIDELILRVTQAGLLSHWQGDAVRFSMDSAIQGAILRNVYMNNNNVVALKIDHVSGALVLLIGGNCLSIICFIIELIQGKMNKDSYREGMRSDTTFEEMKTDHELH